MEDDIKCINLTRKSDGKVITLSELIDICREGKIEDDKIYTYRIDEQQEKPSNWIHSQELRLWAADKKGKEAITKYMYLEGEKVWRRKILDSIEPSMTAERAAELKIVTQIKLLDEQYQITMDGKPVGEPYPMPPGMLEQLMWGKSSK